MNKEISELFSDIKEHILYLNELGADDFGKIEDQNARDASAQMSFSEERSPTPETNQPLRSVVPNTESGSREQKASRRDLLESTKLSKLIVLSESTDFRAEIEKPETLFGDIGKTLPESGETIETIRAEIGNCTRCSLFEGRTQIVHSTGNFQADLMFVGEAPGADEDAQGFPFVGRAGQLLTKIIEGIQLKREDVFIGNINRCRPPGNRAPTLPEAETCRPFLMREIAVVKPKVIVVMGNTACQNLLNTKVGISKLRGRFHDYFGVKVMPTFHPAYLLRDPRKKREVWEDMKKVRDFLSKA